MSEASNDGTGNSIPFTASVTDAVETASLHYNNRSCRGIVSNVDGFMDVVLTKNKTGVPTTEMIFRGFNLYSIKSFVESTVDNTSLRFHW